MLTIPGPLSFSMENPMPFTDCVCFRLGRTARRVTRAYREEIASYGLTHGQFFLIIALMEEDGLLPSELAEKTAQERPTITGLLDRLEKEGWIERKPDTTDRRSLRIFLGFRARECREPIMKLFKETNRLFLDRFSQEEWGQLRSFLARLEQ